MQFKGTIVITDPCYIMKHCYNKPEFSTWKGLEGLSSETPFSEYTEEQAQAYDAYCRASRAYNNDDWNICNYGNEMEELGIHNYFTKSTIYGDWGCHTYQVTDDPKEIVDMIAEIYKLEEEESYKDIPDFDNKYIGSFCADSGQVSVFYLDEILNYNPDFKEWAKEHDWCVTIIPDFDGTVEYYVDANNEAHIIGTGNIKFFTTQTGL